MKTRTMKKGLAFLLSLTMLLGLLPMSVFATGETYTVSYDANNSETNGGYSISSEGGTISYNEDTDTLTVTATGETVKLDSVNTSDTIVIDAATVQMMTAGQAFKFDENGYTYTADGGAATVSYGGPNTVDSGAVSTEAGADGTWDINANAILTVGDVSVTGGENGATLSYDQSSSTYTVSGDVKALTGTGVNVAANTKFTELTSTPVVVGAACTVSVASGRYTFTLPENGYIQNSVLKYTANTANAQVILGGTHTIGAGTVTVTDVGSDAIALTSSYVWNVSSGATLNLNGYTVTGGTAVVSPASATEVEFSGDATVTTTDGLNVTTTAAGNGKFTFDTATTPNTLTVTGGTVTNAGDSDITYGIVIQSGTFDTSGQKVTGTVTFSNDQNENQALQTTTTLTGLPTITDGAAKKAGTNVHYPTNGDDDTFLKEVVFADDAAGYVDGWLHNTPTQTKITIGESAYAAFDYANLEKGANLSIADNATINMVGGRDSNGSGASGNIWAYVNADVINAVGDTYGDDVTFLMGGDGKTQSQSIYGAINTADDSTVTILFYNGGAEMANDITVGESANLTLSGTSANKLTLNQSDEEKIALKDGSTITFNWCADGASLEEKCLKEGTGIIINVTNTDLDDVQIETPDDSKGDGSTLGNSNSYLHDSQAVMQNGALADCAPGDGVTHSTSGGHKRIYSALNENGRTVIIATLDDTAGNGTVKINVAADSKYQITKIVVLNGDDYATEHSILPEGKVVAPGEVYTLTSVGGTIVNLFFEPVPVENPGENVEVTDAVVNFSDDGSGNPVYHKNTFIVADNKTMEINLGKNSGIDAASVFTLGSNSTLTIKAAADAAAVQAPMTISESNVTVTLDGVTWTKTGTNDVPMLTVNSGVTGTKLVVTGEKLSTITGTAGADDTDIKTYANKGTAVNADHTQSAGILNQGGLTIEVDQGATLSVNGGAGKDATTPGADGLYFGGAGVYNTGDLKFTGKGVIALTGGTGSAGANGSSSDGGDAHAGGVGLYNNGGSVTVAMTSETWNEGQLAITGGTGGAGGTGAAYSYSTCNGGELNGYGGGDGGQGGTAAIVGDSFTVESGVFLNYAGAGGKGGSKGTAWCQSHADGKGGNSGNYVTNTAPNGTDGASGDYAITGEKLTVKGGTTYAFGGTNGGSLTSMAVTGGTIFGGKLDNANATPATEYDGFNGGATPITSTDMVPTLGDTGSGFEVTDNSAIGKDGVNFTRIKTGTEGHKYLVKDIVVTLRDGSTHEYKGADTGMYANEQGFLYVYLPDIQTGDAYDKAVVTLKQDGAEVYYKMTCGGASGYAGENDEQKAKSMQAYGYGDVWYNNTNNSRLNYDGNAAWGAEFQLADGTKVANGVDMQLAKGYATWGADGAPQKSPVYDDENNQWKTMGSLITEPYQLATLAYAVNHYKDFNWENNKADFAIGADLDMSALTWTPIGVDADHSFQGVVKGTKGKTDSFTGTETIVKSLRLSDKYTGDAFGLFGYTNGANISYITVNNGDIAGTKYQKTLSTSGYTNFGVAATTSGGEYGWTADKLAWAALKGTSVRYMGAIVANGTNTTVDNCSALDMTLNIEDPKAGAETNEVCVGGLAGKMTGGSIGSAGDAKSGTVDSVSVTANCDGEAARAYAGGVVGWVKDAAVTNVDLSSSGTVSVTALPAAVRGVTYAGGVAGYAKNATISDFVAGRLDGLTITAKTQTGDSNAYAGGAVGESDGTTYDNVVVQSHDTGTPDYSISITAENISSPTSGFNDAAGLVAKSANDIIRDVQIVKGGTGTFVISAKAQSVAGLTVVSSGSKIYKSFVRGVTVNSNSTGEVYSLICNAANMTMAGCYSQGVTSNSTIPAAINTSRSNSTFIGCYTTQGAFIADNDGAKCYNCYYQNGTGTDVAAGDTVVGVSADTLKDDVIGVMNAELMGTEPGNNSGFDYAAEYGSPILYRAATSDTENGGYPVYGTTYLVTVKVVDGAGYGTATLKTGDNTGVYKVYENPDQAAYYVEKDKTPTLVLTPLVDLKDGKAFYDESGSDTPATEVTGLTTINTPVEKTLATAVTNAETISVKFVPTTYTYYTVDLKTGSGADSYSATSGSVTLSGTEVHRYENAGSKVSVDANGNPTDQTQIDDTAKGIKTVILTVDGGATLSGITATGWHEAHVNSGSSYYHYSFPKGISAADVQTALRQLTVTPGSATGKYNVSVYLSETSMTTAIAEAYGGHFYQYIPGSYTWDDAYTNAGSTMTVLGKADTWLATITSSGENGALKGIGVKNAWIGAVNSNKTISGVEMDEGTGWYWVTGPEAGTRFMTSLTGGAVSGQYNNWYTNEPNNAGNEWAAVYNVDGSGAWNDLNGARSGYGYIVEFMADAKSWGDTYANDLFTYTKKDATDPSKPDSNPPTTNDDGDDDGYGSSGTTNTGITEPAAPSATGVNRLLNCVDHGMYLQGYEDGTFRPDRNMTRGQVAMMFYRLLLDQNVTSTQSFSDVSSDYWCAEEIGVLSTLGIVTGYSDGTFRPDQPITRAQFVAIAMRFANKTSAAAKTFSDVPASYWAYSYIASATGFGWINGYSNGTFRPNGYVTRAQVATIVNNMLGRSADEDYVDENRSRLTTFSDVPASYWAYYDIMETANLHDYSKSGSHESWKS